jgi:subtilisin family serine protease
MPADENENGQDASEYYAVPEGVMTELDPELQNVILALRQGRPLPPHLVEEVTEDGEVIIAVDVVAKLHSPDKKVPGLWVVQKIGQVVTGLVDARRITEVRYNPNVISLKAARRLRTTLSHSVPEIRASQEQLLDVLPAGHPPADGSGVIVGFVDHGCDFSHPNFRKLDAFKGTRVLFLWDQRGGTTDASPPDFGYGREFDVAAIDKALRDANPDDDPDAPHRLLGYKIKDGQTISGHGTNVMDVAVGNGGGKNAPGVAPEADIIFVEASLGGFDDFESDESFGNSRHLLDAVSYIFEKARKLRRPAVVNISLSSDAGPHDGSTPVEEAFDHLLETPGRAIVLAAGNSRKKRRHVKRIMHPGQTLTLRWDIQNNDVTSNKLEIWYGGSNALELRLTSPPPGEHELGPFLPGTTHTICRDKRIVGHVFHRVKDSCNGNNHIVLLFNPTAEPGVWTLELDGLGSQLPFDIHAWIETDDITPSLFLGTQPSDDAYTVGTLACGHSTIVVGAYEVNSSGILLDSGEGPSRDGKLKPEVSAPGEVIQAASALTGDVHVTNGGTSLAAPHVSGLIALLMDVAGEPLTIEQTRKLVINATRHTPPPAENSWDSQYGSGRVNAAGSLQALLKEVAPIFISLEKHEVLIDEIISGTLQDAPPGLIEGGVPSFIFESESETILSVASSSEASVLPVGSLNGEEGEKASPPATSGHRPQPSG